MGVLRLSFAKLTHLQLIFSFYTPENTRKPKPEHIDIQLGSKYASRRCKLTFLFLFLLLLLLLLFRLLFKFSHSISFHLQF